MKTSKTIILVFLFAITFFYFSSENTYAGEDNSNNETTDEANAGGKVAEPDGDSLQEGEEGQNTDESAEKQVVSKKNKMQSLEKGMNDDRVVELKEKLSRLGFGSFDSLNNYFGETTEKALKEFQEYFSLSVTGIVDDLTLGKMEGVLSSPFQNGKRHEATITLKENLAILGFLSFENPTTLYGSGTEAGVKAFQEANGLPVSGIYEPITQEYVEGQITGPLQKGMYRDDAIELKENLVRLGFASFSNPNNYFGSQTEQAVEDFQAYYSVSVTGMVDENTLGKMGEVLSSPFQNGRRHEATITLKENLAILGFLSFKNPTTFYGSGTEAGVKAFQEANGLPVSGIYEPITQELVEEQITGPLKKGMYRNDAIALKEDLVRLGFASFSNPNNYFGSQTEQAVEDFQAYYSVSVTGMVDENTLGKMGEVLSSPFQNGKRHEATITLKENLAILGFLSFKNPTTFYGSGTEAGVKAFQEANGLPVSGIYEPITKEHVEDQITGPLKKGMYRDDAIELKENLVRLGFASFKDPNNYFGSQTEQAVEDFQAYYSLSKTGIADEPTLGKMEEVLSSPFQNGKRHEATIILKENLAVLGFLSFNNPTTLYGSETEAGVKAFQEANGLPVSGIYEPITKEHVEDQITGPLKKGMYRDDAIELKENLVRLGFASFSNPNNYFGSQTEQALRDLQGYYNLSKTGVANEDTLKKIEEVLSSPFQNGKRHEKTIEMKKDLNRLGFLSFNNPTTFYGPTTEAGVKAYQEHFNLPASGIAESTTLAKIDEILSSPFQKGKRHQDTIEIKEDLALLGYLNFSNPTTYYGTTTEKAVAQFQRSNKLPVSGIVDSITLEQIKVAVENRVVKIFLDPGHGAHDPGGRGYGLNEKDVVLDIALYASQILENNYTGVEVMLSRTNDVFVELEDRAKMANQWGADYFVSIHNNAFNGTANGFESFIFNGNVSNETETRQNEMHNFISNKLNVYDRGEKTANFSVLRNSNMPSILLEYLFIDNFTENSLLKNKSYRNFLGKTTADAIAHSFSLKKR
ncbi:peptidoglycan-binding protein [Oceanobacillus kapialis]|uniref:peptidoglycan-binding protein n=1 Tax=Oceanobacillus kapialis TaxID=481353 RepID=UPI00384FD06E